MPGRGELTHVQADLGENDLRVHRADARNLIESLDRGQRAGVARSGGCSAGGVPTVDSFGLHCGQQVLDAGGGEVGEIVTLKTDAGARVTWVYLTDPEGNIVELQSWSA